MDLMLDVTRTPFCCLVKISQANYPIQEYFMKIGASPIFTFEKFASIPGVQ